MYNNRATHTGASAKLSRRVSRNSSRSTNRLYVSSAKINVLLKWTTSCGKMHGIDRPAGSKLRGRRAAGCRGAAHERLHNGWGGRRVGGWACQSIRWDDNGTSGLCSDFIFLCKNTVDISLHENMGQCVNIYLIKITWYSLWAVNHLIRDDQRWDSPKYFKNMCPKFTVENVFLCNKFSYIENFARRIKKILHTLINAKSLHIDPQDVKVSNFLVI